MERYIIFTGYTKVFDSFKYPYPQTVSQLSKAIAPRILGSPATDLALAIWLINELGVFGYIAIVDH